MPAKFNNMLMTGGTLNFAEGDINFHSSGESTTDRGIASLFGYVAPGAFHDSGERFDPPKCHPNTRLAVIQEILDWLDDPESPELVMWLNGAAGAGKSAIAQTIAQILFGRGRLSGSFFFARGSTTGRGDEKRLVPTLSYQLSKFLPETRFHIATTINNDPALFHLSLLSQVQSLLVDPLWLALNAFSSSYNASPRLFIIDGLDECHNADIQCLILKVFAAAMKSMPDRLPQKLLIASRSEIHLLTGFNEHDTATVCRRLPLDHNYLPDNDIRLYLQETLSKIKREHHMRASLDNPWPSDEDISSLVMKSSGQFIYASTVVKYVTSPRHHPAERLKIILGLKTAGRNDRPFAALDSLYTHIFQNVEDIDLVLCILRMDLAGSFVAVPRGENKAGVRRNVLGVTVDELEMALGDLISVITFDHAEGWFRYLHASIPDFLLDSQRSGTFYVDQPKVNLYRAGCCVKVICHIYSNRHTSNAALHSGAWFHLSDCTGRLVHPQDKEFLYLSLSSLDVGRVLDHHFHPLWRSPSDFRYIGQVLLWSMQERQMHSEQAASLMLTYQFDSWLLSRLQSVPVNGFEASLGIDFILFSMTQIDGQLPWLHLRGLVENDFWFLIALATALNIPYGELICPSIWFCSKNTEYILLLHHFFHDFKRSGKYFMSGTRYANAALYCVNLLFGTRNRHFFDRGTLYLAMKYVTFSLRKATALKTLFDLLLGAVTIPNSSGISNIISVIEINARNRLNSRIDEATGVGMAKTDPKWEESIQMVVTAISEYVSTTCQFFFPQN